MTTYTTSLVPGEHFIFTKRQGEAAMPATLEVVVQSIPLLNGLYKKSVYLPQIYIVGTMGTTGTIYDPPDAARFVNVSNAASLTLACVKGNGIVYALRMNSGGIYYTFNTADANTNSLMQSVKYEFDCAVK